MQEFKGMGYDAVSIEHDFAKFFGSRIGDRTTFHDADVFRGGNRQSLAEVVQKFAEHLEQRVAGHRFHPEEEQDGGAKVRLDMAVKSLKQIADVMSKSTEDEPQDYHWLIVGELVTVISSLLDHFEGNGHSVG